MSQSSARSSRHTEYFEAFLISSAIPSTAGGFVVGKGGLQIAQATCF